MIDIIKLSKEVREIGNKGSALAYKYYSDVKIELNKL